MITAADETNLRKSHMRHRQRAPMPAAPLPLNIGNPIDGDVVNSVQWDTKDAIENLIRIEMFGFITNFKSLSPVSGQTQDMWKQMDRISSFHENRGILLVPSFPQDTVQEPGCSPCTSDHIMSESLLTDAPTAIAAETRDDHVVLPFSSMQSLITTSDGVDDGTQSFVSLDPIIPDDRLAANHGSDPMIASVRRSGSLGDIRILGLQQRSFSMEDTSFNKENHFENNVSKNCASSKSVDQNDSSINYGGPPDPLNSPSGSNGGCEEVLCAKDHPLISDLATERDEDIRRIEETAYCIMDGVELPRASDPGVFCPNEDDCVSPTVLLDDSMTPLVGTPHAMSYIPMEDIFTFVDRRPNQELPAITEENEEQTLRRQRHYRSSLSGRRSRSPSRSAPLEEGGQAASNPDLEAELVKELWYPIDNEIPSAGYVHRRAISDNLGVQPVRPELQRSQEMEEIDRAGNDEDVHMRSARAVARASSVVTNRCQSQVFLTQIGLNDAAASAPVLDRNLSSSDPSVNDEKTSSKTQECPPPVLLTRKASSIHNETWKNQCAPETAAQPTPVQVRKEPVGTGSRPQSMTRTEKPSDRIEKKKTKSGSDTFSFGSLFGSNKGARSKKKMGNDRSLETVISSFQSRAPHGSAVSFPSRRVVPSMDHPTRLPIPDFEGLQFYPFSKF
ncbi:hypothetical protein Q1695_009026 [Nippostrongylus brasiliensis]|nr:hypothetical protein Q1695_009026 [Nippostrongylus brasiliensis]